MYRSIFLRVYVMSGIHLLKSDLEDGRKAGSAEIPRRILVGDTVEKAKVQKPPVKFGQEIR